MEVPIDTMVRSNIWGRTETERDTEGRDMSLVHSVIHKASLKS